jgi:hypothetical protein
MYDRLHPSVLVPPDFAARGGNREASVKVLPVDDHAIVRA